MTTQSRPRRAKDPSASEIAERAAKIRRRWSAATEREHRVQHVAPVIYWPVAVEEWAAVVER
jgi:hypothetical protein